ncbi:unnamed protein product [Prorocentrum cordatum]|nr:unnamed protein product [Polarella glacialis]
MVGAEVPAPGMHGATPDVPLVCPPTPSRQVLRKRLNESLGPDDSALIREELDDAERARHAGHGAPPDVGSGARADVRKAYLQLAKHYHPDKGGDQDMFLAIHSAYEVLNRTESTASADSALARSR